MRAGTLVVGLPALVAVVIGLLWSPSSPRYAVHTLPADESALVLARDAGFDTIVELFSWREIEPTQGQFFWQRPDEVVAGAQYHGLDLVVRLDQHPVWASPVSIELNAPPADLADYVSFVSRVAERYRGRVLGYVIWNEPNLAGEWGGEPPDPVGYSELLCRAYEAIKAQDPEVLVVSAGLASTNHMDPLAMDDRGFLAAMLEGGAESCFDVLGAHPYGFGYPPDDPRGAHESLNLARIQDLRDILVARGLENRPIWATEMGWTVDGSGENGWQAVTLQEQADFLMGALARGREDWPWLGLMSVWNLNGNGDPNWKGYSLLDSKGQPRPAYWALRQWLADHSSRRSREQLQASASVYPVLAPDSVIHLGDSDFSEPWMPLFDNRNPSTTWRGIVYLDNPGGHPWRLSLRVMQPNVWDNYVWVNGCRLEPAMPQEDFGGSWVSLTWPVPAHWLQPGANQVAVTIGRTLPVLQDEAFAWDDLQLKDVVLRRE